MPSWMRDEEFVPHAPSHVGKVRHNHESPDCAGGRDSMTIERLSDGSIRAYCFRCSARGYRSAVLHRPSSYRAHYKSRDGDGHLSHGPSGYAKRTHGFCPSDSTGRWADYPALAQRWLLSGGMDSSLCSKYGIVWSDRSDALFLPVLRNGDTAGYAMRKLSPKTYRPLTSDFPRFFGWMRNGTSKVVIVEDILSCYRVHEAGFDAIALMGTEIKDSVIDAVREGKYGCAVVFLDADNPTVRMKARRIAKRLPFVHTRVLETGKDPKRHTEEELKCLLT